MKSLKEIITSPIKEAMGGKSFYGFKGEDEIGSFWVVTKADKNSEMMDIISKADIFDLHLMLRGGLKPRDIIGIYKKESKARKKAEQQMAKYWDGF